MSDFILKIFPVSEIDIDKTEEIKNILLVNKFISTDTIDFSGDTHYKPGKAFCEYFEFEDENTAFNTYKTDVTINIAVDGQGVIMEDAAEEPGFIDRKNVVEIWNADGNYTNWDKLTYLLQQATGDAYTGQWDIL